jgi:CBS domain-containing protein
MIDPLDRPVREHMARVLSALGPNTSLAAAGKLLADQHLSGAPVVDDQGKLLGVISRADLVEASASATVGVARYHVLHDGKTLTSSAIPGAEGATGVVAERMTRDVLTIGGDAPLRDAVRRMVTREVHRLLVVDGERLVGLVSTMDVLRALVPDRPPEADQGF